MKKQYVLWTVRRGLVRYVGFSIFLPGSCTNAGNSTSEWLCPFVAAQMYYSLLGRDIEHEMVPFVEDTGIGIWCGVRLPVAFLAVNTHAQRLYLKILGGKTFGFPPVDIEQGL